MITNILLVLLLSLMAAHLKFLHGNVIELRSQCNLSHYNWLSYQESTRNHIETLTASITYLQEKYPEMELRITAAENTAVTAENTVKETQSILGHFVRSQELEERESKRHN